MTPSLLLTNAQADAVFTAISELNAHGMRLVAARANNPDEEELSRLFHRRAVPYNTGKVSIGSRYQYRSLSPSDSNGFSGPHRQPQRSDRIVVPACVAIGALLALLMILGVV